MKKLDFFRTKYPEFIYRKYAYELKNGDLHLSFTFEVPARNASRGDTEGGEINPAPFPEYPAERYGIKFRPKVVVKYVSQKDIDGVGERAFENLVFQLGLAEMPSYWKATASPLILVEAGSLNKQQLNWWHGLFVNGMGQYFYENKIDFTKPNFLRIASSSQGHGSDGIQTVFRRKLSPRILLPIGGGKDAVVTYKILKDAKQRIRPFVLNPKAEQFAILRTAGERNPLLVRRTIDPKLLQLNRKGFLNGHTPYSSYLAFLTALCAALFDYKYIALSNERSSNEGNVEYRGKAINHQYSKSFDFEKKFRWYSRKYLASDIEYFSFLRPLYEIQIAKLFNRYPKYFPAFVSCNETHKTYSGRKPKGLPVAAPDSGTKAGKWCGKCAKCLFVFACLYPFVDEARLIKIFGSNLFEDKTLIPLMRDLVGEKNFKPFECVGTTKESLAAFFLCLRKQKANPPVVLKYFQEKVLPEHKNLPQTSERILSSWNNHHAVPPRFSKILRGQNI